MSSVTSVFKPCERYNTHLQSHRLRAVHHERISCESTIKVDDEPSTQKVAVKSLKDVMSIKTCWKQPFSEAMEEKLTHVLDTKKNEREHVARVYSTTLMQEDFQTLGLQRNVEATGIQVWTSNSYVNVTLIPPRCADPILHIPVDASAKDCILFPSFSKSHWMLCVSHH